LFQITPFRGEKHGQAEFADNLVGADRWGLDGERRTGSIIR
jgi:hypothetical protein